MPSTLIVARWGLKKLRARVVAWFYGILVGLLGILSGWTYAQDQGQDQSSVTNIVSRYHAQDHVEVEQQRQGSKEDAAQEEYAEWLRVKKRAAKERTQQIRRNETALFDAIRIDSRAKVFDLIWAGADPNILNERGEPALVWALKVESYKAADTLALAPDIDFNLTNANGEDALMMASLRGQTELVIKMLKKGAHPNKSGWTALHYAATAASIPVIEKLLEAGANIDAQSPQELTPLMMAARYGSDLSVQSLINAGANYLAKDKQGRTAAEYAQGAGKDQLAQKLRILIRARLQRP